MGKLTVGSELAKLTSFALFHNHLVVDAMLAVFPFGSEPFVRLRNDSWLAVFREAVAVNLDVIFTFSPEWSVPRSFIQDVRNVIEGGRNEVIFVELTCSAEEQERRIDAPSRSAFRKLNSLSLLQEVRSATKEPYPMPDANLILDTEELTPPEAAAAIADYISSNGQKIATQ